MKRLHSLTAVFKYINKHPLGGKHRLSAYFKFFVWQLRQLINPAERIVPFVGKTSLSVNKGMTGATGNIYLGLHDFYEMAFLLHFLTKEDLFADVGANIGSYSILASGVKGSKTIAFEPSLVTFSQLQKNIVLNHLEENIKAYNLALGAKVDTLSFTVELDTVNHVVPDYELRNTRNRIEVNVDALDNMVNEHGVPALIKIDVEGFETEVINGMEKTVRDQTLKAIIIELNGSGMRYGYDENDIHNKLISHGFQPYLYNPFKRTFNLSEKRSAYNTLYLRDILSIQERVLKADKIKIFGESF